MMRRSVCGKLSVWLVALMISFSAFGQVDVKFTSITVKEGLSSNTVNAIIKDKYGLIWFATTNGLTKFDGTNFTVYRHDPDQIYSLPGNEVLSLYEDSRGTIWLGTNAGGVSYYDRKFDRFLPYRGDGSWPEIGHISVRAFREDYKGQIWVATYGELRTIDLATGHITDMPINSDEFGNNKPSVVLSLFEDSRKQMWAGTDNGLFLYNRKNNKFKRFMHDPADPASLRNNVIKAITEDSFGNVWFGTYDGLVQMQPSGRFKYFFHDSRSASSISNDAVFAIASDIHGRLWVGTEDGINIYDPANQMFQRLKPDYRNIYSLRSRSIRSIFIDPSGIYWIGTFGGGVNKFDRHLPLFNLKESIPFDPYGLKSSIVTSFAEGRDEKIFIGTDGAGIETFNKRTGLLSPLPIRSKLNTSENGLTIFALHKDHKGYLWAATYHDGLFRITPESGEYLQFVADGTAKGLSHNNVSALTEDASGKIWIGTLGQGIDIYDPATKSFQRINKKTVSGSADQALPLNDFITSLVQAPDGDMWIGSVGTGIAVYHSKDGKFIHYSKTNSKLADDIVKSMLFAKDGTLWVGTDQGVCCFDPKTKSFTTFDEKQGLANGSVKTILEDNDGLLWLSTDRGISCFDRTKKTFRNFTSENGIQQSAFLSGSGIKTANGDLYFGGQEGFNFFNPEELPTPSNPGTVFLTDLKVSNLSVVPGENSPLKTQIGLAQEIRLKYGQNFSLSYVALDYTMPKQNIYAYKLVDFDKDWNYVHNTRTANYTNLDPGTYTFQVKVSNNSKLWLSPTTEIRVIVTPPFWRTGIAYLCYVLLACTILFLIRRRGIQKIKHQFEREREKLQIKQTIEQQRLEAERLHELDMLKIKFLTDLSHEFRTPISLINAPVEKLLEKKLPDEVNVHLHMISRNVKRLLNLVNQLLDFRKMEEQELKLNLIPGDIIDFITESAESFKDVAARKQIRLEIKNACDSWLVNFDHDKLERVIFNLLSNAFKFTPAGGSVSLETDVVSENAGYYLLLSLSDTGVGVAEADLDRIFERFYQASQQNDNILNSGTGIGLSITKEFIELHGGRISAERLPVTGLKFVVKLPLTTIAEPVKQHWEEIQQNTNGDECEIKPEITEDFEQEAQMSTTVLLVEDNDEFREYLVEHLKQYYQIIEASNGREGWQKTLSAHPQLVVSDISMPEMSGIELSKKIKADKRTSHIPVILLTAMTGEEDQLKGLKSGASDYLTKPFNFQILNVRISNLLNLNRSFKDTYSKQIHLVGQKVETESADLKLLNCIMSYIEQDLSNPDLSVEELSKHVGMSRGSLYYKLIELTGATPVEYIRNVRLDKAAALLESSDYNVAQIAYITGFGTPSYFSKMFKGKYNMLPSEFLNVKRNAVKSKTGLALVKA